MISDTNNHQPLASALIYTPLGQMIAIASDEALYLLNFTDQPKLAHKIKNLAQVMQTIVMPGENKTLSLIQAELAQYFDGKLTSFKTPCQFLGTAFQQQTWHGLKQISYAQTISYGELAQNINKPKAFRAAAKANGANKLAIIVPCHRVINANQSLGGYNGGIARKQWLLHHERQTHHE